MMSDKLFRQVGNVVTEYTDDEYRQHYKDLQEQQLRKNIEAQTQAESQAKREVALAKLAALGLEPDDLTALGL
jgi:hypothetical protein